MTGVPEKTELDELIAQAFTSVGQQADANKVYLAVIRTLFYVPVEKNYIVVDEQEPFRPLFAAIEDKYFMLAFDTVARLQEWAGEHHAEIAYVAISGRDIISGLGEPVYLGLNLGTPFYKELTPDEIKRIKMVIARIDQLRPPA